LTSLPIEKQKIRNVTRVPSLRHKPSDPGNPTGDRRGSIISLARVHHEWDSR